MPSIDAEQWVYVGNVYLLFQFYSLNWLGIFVDAVVVYNIELLLKKFWWYALSILKICVIVAYVFPPTPV